MASVDCNAVTWTDAYYTVLFASQKRCSKRYRVIYAAMKATFSGQTVQPNRPRSIVVDVASAT